MVVAPTPLCPKVRYLSPLEAERDAGAHPFWQPRCEKCDLGRPFGPYRCPDDPSHWHLGHGLPREEEENVLASMNNLPDAKVAPLRAGDRWRSVSAKGMGLPVEIDRVTLVNVQFHAVGRGADEARNTLPIDAFRTRFAPLKLAPDRQKRLAEAARSAPVAAQPSPARTTADPVEVAVEEVKAEQQVASASEPTPTAPSPWEAQRPPGGQRRGLKLTAEQAREIWQLRHDGGSLREIAATYGIAGPTVSNIGRGRMYGWATADLRANAEQPAQQQQEEPPVQITKPPIVVETKRDDDYQALKDRLALQQVRAHPVVERIVHPGPDPLVAEMADALELLLDHGGPPLPKFVYTAIRALVERARA